MKRTVELWILVVLLIVSGGKTALAADPLTGPEVKALLSGSVVWAKVTGTDRGSGTSSLAMAQSASLPVQIKFSPDGSVTRSFVGVRHGRREDGRWWVNKKGMLCLQWQDQAKKGCSRLVPTSSGGYELYGKGGKRRQLVFDKVTK